MKENTVMFSVLACAFALLMQVHDGGIPNDFEAAGGVPLTVLVVQATTNGVERLGSRGGIGFEPAFHSRAHGGPFHVGRVYADVEANEQRAIQCLAGSAKAPILVLVGQKIAFELKVRIGGAQCVFGFVLFRCILLLRMANGGFNQKRETRERAESEKQGRESEK